MTEKLTPAKIEEIGRHYENIQSGKTPIIKSEKEISAHLDVSKLMEKKEDKKVLPLIPPSDPRLLMQIAPFEDSTLEQFNMKDRKDLSKIMYDTMIKYGGLGLSCNQVGLPYRMFVMGGHPSIEEGKVRYVFNPLVNDMSEETINLKDIIGVLGTRPAGMSETMTEYLTELTERLEQEEEQAERDAEEQPEDEAAIDAAEDKNAESNEEKETKEKEDK